MPYVSLFEMFDRHIRAEGVGAGTARLIRSGPVLLQKGEGYVFVSHWNFTKAEAPQILSQLVREAREEGRDLVWRLYDRDGPASLVNLVNSRGFHPSSPGWLVARQTSEVSLDAYDAVRIVEVTDEFTARHYLNVSACAFGNSLPPDADVDTLLVGNSGKRFIAYYGDQAAAVACIDLRPGNPAALLSGGAVHPNFRGLGLYRTLVLHRLRLAFVHGATVAFCEARETSSPILLKLGFARIAQETTWTRVTEQGRSAE